MCIRSADTVHVCSSQCDGVYFYCTRIVQWSLCGGVVLRSSHTAAASTATFSLHTLAHTVKHSADVYTHTHGIAG